MKKIICVLLICTCMISIFAITPMQASAYSYSAPKVYLTSPTDHGIHVKFNLKPGVTRYRIYYKDLRGSWQRAGSDYTVSSSDAKSGRLVDRSITIPWINNRYHGCRVECTMRYLSSNGKSFLSGYKSVGFYWRKAPNMDSFNCKWDKNFNLTYLKFTFEQSPPDAYTIFVKNKNNSWVALAKNVTEKSYTFSKSQLNTINSYYKGRKYLPFTLRETLGGGYCSTYWDSAITLQLANAGRYGAINWNTNL